ncbi:MAG: tyrosine/phenylalanine carboxypeptidase domain-containing protein [Polyangiaceae bacterium]
MRGSSKIAWTTPFGEALALAMRGIHLLSSSTPTNAIAERARLVDAATHDAPLVPNWTYARPRLDDARMRLELIARELEMLTGDPLATVYRDRALELMLEAELAQNVGEPRFANLAIQRFSAPSMAIAKKAGALAKRFQSAKIEADIETIPCDDDHVDSLLSCMRREIGARLLPFRVVVQPALPSLAATGDGVILIGSGRRISRAAALRTVLHEIEGHALPRVRAARQELDIFRIGTARGIDDQEGFALLLEDRGGFLEGERQRDLAARAFAVGAMRNGANFAEIVRILRVDYLCAVPLAIAIAERIFRGSNGVAPGLGRESIYLQSFIRVRDLFAAAPEAERVLHCGQVSVGAWSTLLPHITQADA